MLRRNSIDASPDLARREGLDIKASDNAEVAAATLQGPEEIGVGGLIGVDNAASGQDNLVVDDTVRSPSDLVAVVADTSSQEKTWYANGSETATGNGQVELFKILVYSAPAR